MRGPEALICDSYTLFRIRAEYKGKFFQIISILKGL